MKKKLLIAAMLVLALSATACSKKAEETTAAPETTEAVTEAVTTEATTEEPTEEEDVDEDYMSGRITKFTDTILTIKNDDGDETEKDYDISDAEIIRDFPFAEGDWVEITFPAETAETPVPVIRVEVLDSVIADTTDPSVQGMVEDATMNTITLKLEDGESYTFNTANAYVVGKDGITADKEATVTFTGDVEDTDPIPLAVKVVMEDSYNTPEAELYAFSGEVEQIVENSIVLKSADGGFYTFTSDDIDFSSYKKGDSLQVFYTGTITEKAIPATKIVK